MKKKMSVLFGIALICVLCAGTALAGSVDVPNVFTPNTPAKADSVNENFSAVELAVDDNAAMISSLQNAHSSTRTGYFSVPVGTMSPGDESYNYTRFSGITIYPADATPQTYFGPVHLPHGAVVTSLKARVFDSDAANNATAGLWAYCQNTEAAIASITSSHGDATAQIYEDTTIGSWGNPVDNSDCSYYARVDVDPTSFVQVQKIIITYEYSID